MFVEWELYEQTGKILGTASQKGDIVLCMYKSHYDLWTVYNPIRNVQFAVGSMNFGAFKKIEGVIE